MVRSMYSGVSGMRAHQTRMDTIGNNIANVNTYGFKSSRTTFRDIYYQNMSAASSPTAAAGGMNPSQVGYGGKVGSVDLMMGRSTFSMTDEAMDLAIDGDGFLQVMDSAGNIYYTRAGMTKFDAEGNLVDMQGNFVLGVNGDPTGRAAGSEKIRVSLPPVVPKEASVEQTLNGKVYEIKTSKQTNEGNVNVNIITDATLPDDTVEATVSSNGGIVLKMHPDNMYSTWAQLNNDINAAIYRANGNKEHPAGTFTIGLTNGADPMNDGPISAADLCSTDYSVKSGTVSFGEGNSYFGGIAPLSVGSKFSGDGTIEQLDCAYKPGPPAAWEVTLKVSQSDGSTVTYTGKIDENKTSSGEFKLMSDSGDSEDYITMKRPAFNDITAAWNVENPGGTPPDSFTTVMGTAMGGGTAPAVKPSTPSRAQGLSGNAFALRGGTAGGAQGLADMTGISIAPNGVIVGLDSQGTEVIIGRIDIATFANQSGLQQAGSSNYAASANSGEARISQPGTNGSGKLVSSSLELSNVDLSREFSDMITTQRGYQANSRIITVSDTMLEELINLKR